MKKLAAISLVLIYAISFTEIHQFLKLPVLWQHYAEHQQNDSSITFLEYLSHHYETHANHDGHDDRHGELPFKDFDHCFCVHAVTLSQFKFDLQVEFSSFEKNYACYYKKFITSFHLTKIWQPPRIS
jgi:hypothetical protein